MTNTVSKFARLIIRAGVVAAAIVALLMALAAYSGDATPEKKPLVPPAETSVADKPQKTPDEHPKQLFAGKVVMLHDALKRRKIKSYEDETKNQVVLETEAGELIPIVPDWRGRAFYQDKRLRDRRVELIGFRRPGVPYLEVLTVFTFNEKGERQYTDYWCDICAIPMYEIKPCDCCQGPIRLRFQPKDLPDYLRTKPGPSPSSAAQGAKKQ